MMSLLQFLSEVIDADLSHISSRHICQGKTRPTVNMLEIIMNLADIVLGEWGPVAQGFGSSDPGARPRVEAAQGNDSGPRPGVTFGQPRSAQVAPTAAEEDSGEEDSEERRLRALPGRHMALRARARRTSPRAGSKTFGQIVSEEVKSTLGALSKRHGPLAGSGAREGWVVKAPVGEASSPATKAQDIKVTVPRRGNGRLKLPGYMRPTSAALGGANYTEKMTEWGTGGYFSPRMARPRTAPPASSTRGLPLAEMRLSQHFTDDEGEGSATAHEAGGAMGEGLGGGGGSDPAALGVGMLTPADELKWLKAKTRAVMHSMRREQHAQKEHKKLLVRLHEGSWLAASHQLALAVKQRVQTEATLRQEAELCEQRRQAAVKRQEAAAQLAAKVALDSYARDQAQLAAEAVRARTTEALVSAKAAVQETKRAELEAAKLHRRKVDVACARIQDAYASQTFAYVHSLAA